jgi:hypothetical protein
MQAFLDRLRENWVNLSEREQRLALAMGGMFGAMLLGLPLYLMASGNWDLEDQNATLRATLDHLEEQRVPLMQAAEERRAAAERYGHKTPPLGSFLEQEAKKQGLTLREVTDQPEKAQGRYLKRNVRAAMPGVGLTPVINLLSSIMSSPHPVAIDQIQMEHFQPGDLYNVKIGVLTYDKQAGDASGDKPKTASKSGSSAKESN